MTQGMRFPPPPLMEAQPPGAFDEMKNLAGGRASTGTATSKIAEAGKLLMAAAQQQSEENGDPSWVSTITPILRSLTEMTSASLASQPPDGSEPPGMEGGAGMPPGIKTLAMGPNAPTPMVGPSGGPPIPRIS